LFAVQVQEAFAGSGCIVFIDGPDVVGGWVFANPCTRALSLRSWHSFALVQWFSFSLCTSYCTAFFFIATGCGWDVRCHHFAKPDQNWCMMLFGRVLLLW